MESFSFEEYSKNPCTGRLKLIKEKLGFFGSEIVGTALNGMCKISFFEGEDFHVKYQESDVLTTFVINGFNGALTYQNAICLSGMHADISVNVDELLQTFKEGIAMIFA